MMDDRRDIVLEDGQADWRWTRGFVANVAAAIATAITSDRSSHGVYNVGDEPTLTEREWVDAIGAAVGWKGSVLTVSRERMLDNRESLDWRYPLWLDTTRIRRELDYVEHVSLEVALERSVEWERAT